MRIKMEIKSCLMNLIGGFRKSICLIFMTNFVKEL